MFKTFILISLAVALASATHGVDIADFMGPYTVSQWQCLKNNGIDFAIIQIWRGGYQLSDHFTIDYNHAKAAGIQYVDAYAYIANNCRANTPDNICTSIKGALPSDFKGMLWLDVEDCTDCWTGTPADRLKFLTDVADVCEAKGITLGVYSGNGSWSQVFGSASFGSGALTKYPLWYAHYDNNPSFTDYSAIKFGSWSNPSIKQYNGGSTICGISQLDLDAY